MNEKDNPQTIKIGKYEIPRYQFPTKGQNVSKKMIDLRHYAQEVLFPMHKLYDYGVEYTPEGILKRLDQIINYSKELKPDQLSADTKFERFYGAIRGSHILEDDGEKSLEVMLSQAGAIKTRFTYNNQGEIGASGEQPVYYFQDGYYYYDGYDDFYSDDCFYMFRQVTPVSDVTYEKVDDLPF